MLPKGPPWMKTGLCSIVCTRLGASASFNSTVIAPAALTSPAVTGLRSRVWPTTILPSRRCRSCRLVARQNVAMTCEAAVMSNQSSRGEQVVGGADGVDVAGEMQVDVLHRQGLGIAAAGGTALDAEARAKARLAQAQHRLLANQVQRIAEPDGSRRLAFTGWRRSDRGDEDQLGVRPVWQRAEVVEGDLRLVFAVRLQSIARDPEFLAGDLADRAHHCFQGDLDIGFWVSVLLFSARHGVFSIAG